MTRTRCHRTGACRVLYSTHERTVVMDIRFEHQDGIIYLKAPFNREANQDYKDIGGKWSPDKRMWGFESRDLNKVRSEEHTSELQSRFELVCHYLLEKQNAYKLLNELDILLLYRIIVYLRRN